MARYDISSGVISTGITLNYDSMYISSGGTANSTTVNSGGYMNISSGGTANSTTVNSWGHMYISSGGVANNTTVNSGGDMYISSGVVANSTTVNSSGRMYIYSGGTATDIVANSGARLHITVAPDTYIQGTYAGSAFEMKEAQISGYTVNYGGYMYISSGGVANSTTVNSGGDMYISSGGVASSTTVKSGGRMYISSGGNANSITLLQGGQLWQFSFNEDKYIDKVVDGSAVIFPHVTIIDNSMHIASGGIANSTIVNSGGCMYISSGGVANNTTVNSGGSMHISSGGTASIEFNPWLGDVISSAGATVEYLERNANIYYGGKSGFISKYDTYDSLEVTFGNSAIIYSDGIADNTAVESGGRMYISSGGTANGTTLFGGWMYVYSGSVANGTTVSCGSMYVYSGSGVANSATIYGPGKMYISSGGVANATTVSCGDMYISNGGTANSTTVDYGGDMNISNGGVANSTTVNSWGRMYITSGGVANSTTVNSGGYMYISSGCVVNSTTVNSCGRMYISSGGVHRGSLQIESGAVVSAYEGSIIDFTVAERSVNDGYLINDLSLIFGTPTYTITVSTDQAFGTYKLAQGAENLSGSIAIGDNNAEYGSITVNGEILKYNGVDYQLTLNDRNLVLVVGDIIPPAVPAATASITTLTNKDVTITVIYSEDSAVKQYRIGASGAWQDYTGAFTVTDNATVYFRAEDAVGNESTSEFVIDYIDKIAPTLEISGNATTWTNQDVTLTATASDGTVEFYNGTEWIAGAEQTISSNGTYKFRVTDAAGNVAEKEIIVDNIDREAPDAPVLSSNMGEKLSNTPVTITAAANGTAIEYSFDKQTWYAYNDGVVAECNGEYYFRAVDAAGNISAITSYVVDKIDCTADVSTVEYIFISAKYNAMITGKKQNGIVLEWGKNAFSSLEQAGDTAGKTVIVLDSKSSGTYLDMGTIAGTTVIATVKDTDNAYNYKATSTPKGTLTLTSENGSTEFIRFATVNVNGAVVNTVAGGKAVSSENTKSAIDKKGTVTDTENSSVTNNANGKFTALNGAIVESVSGYAAVSLTQASVTELTGGNTKSTASSKLVDGTTKDQNTISGVTENIAAGSVTLKNKAEVNTITGYSNVTLTDSIVGNITNFTSKDSKSDKATFDEAKNKVTRKVTLSHNETTAGTLKATNSTLGDVTGFATVTLKDVSSAGDFRRIDENGNLYSTVKETLDIKTAKDGSVSGTYTKTETFTRAGKFTATGSTVGDIENFSTVTLDNSRAQAISNFEVAKVVTKDTANWDSAAEYGRPDDYDLYLDCFDLEPNTQTTKSLNGSVTLKNGAYAESISNFKSVTMTGSEVGSIKNVTKVTVNKGDSAIGSYIGTADNDTFTIAKGAVLTADKLDLGEGAKDTLAINGTLILTGTEVVADKFSGKGEIVVVDSLFDKLDLDFANILNVGATAGNFRGTAYENADDTAKKAVKWDGKSEYNGWLGSWEGCKTGSDTVDYIKFTAQAGDELIVDGVEYWTLLDKKGNNIGKEITAAGEYTIQLKHEKETSIDYTIKLA